MLKKTLEYQWGFSCKVDGRVIAVEGEHSNPQNLKDYLFDKLTEIEFVTLGGVKLKTSELKTATPEEENVIWFKDEKGNIIKKSDLSLSAQKMIEELEKKGLQLTHKTPETKFENNDEVITTKELSSILQGSPMRIPEGLKGKIRTKNMAGYMKHWTYIITFPGYGDVEIEGGLADQMLKKASLDTEGAIGDTLRQWEANKGELMKLQMIMKQLQGKQQELLSEVKQELSGSSEEVKEIDGYVIKYKSWEQRKPPSYKMAFEKVLTKVNGQIRKLMTDMVEEMTTMSTREKLDIVRMSGYVTQAGLPDWLKSWWGKFVGKIKRGWSVLTKTLGRGKDELRRLTEEAEKAPDVQAFYDGTMREREALTSQNYTHSLMQVSPRLISLATKKLKEVFRVAVLKSHIEKEKDKFVVYFDTDRGTYKAVLDDDPVIVVVEGQGNWLEIDIPKGKFYFEKDNKVLHTREEAEAYLVSQYGISPAEAKRVIDQGATLGGFNLDTLEVNK